MTAAPGTAARRRRSRTTDLTTGPLGRGIIVFALPLPIPLISASRSGSSSMTKSALSPNFVTICPAKAGPIPFTAPEDR